MGVGLYLRQVLLGLYYEGMKIYGLLMLFLARRGRQRCRARLISIVLGVKCIFSMDGGRNDGHVHFNLQRVSDYGRMLVKDVVAYWKGATEVR